jgi:hypothetical protein
MRCRNPIGGQWRRRYRASSGEVRRGCAAGGGKGGGGGTVDAREEMKGHARAVRGRRRVARGKIETNQYACVMGGSGG